MLGLCGVQGAMVTLDVELCGDQREEPVLTEAFLAELPVEALDKHVLNGLARSSGPQRDPAAEGPADAPIGHAQERNRRPA